MKKIIQIICGILIIIDCCFIQSTYGARFSSEIDLKNPSNNQFSTIIGENSNDGVGASIAAGDINGDSYTDLIIGAYTANEGKGITYVIFGSASFFNDDILDLESESSGILKINGENILDWSGFSVASGNINGDLYDDIIIGAYRNDPQDRINAGKVYVIYGSSTLTATGTINLAGSPSGVTQIYGDQNVDYTGFSVSSGNINGDSYDDIIIGAYQSDISGRVNGGKAYVIFGSSSFQTKSTLDLRSSPSGVLSVYGETAGDLLGYSVTAGDLDNNGYDDLIIGAYDAYDSRGGTYIISGYSEIDTLTAIDTAAPPDGTVIIYGEDANDHSGGSVAAKDLDNDTYDDLIIGAPGGSTNKGETNIFRGGPAFKSMGTYYLGEPTFELLRVIGEKTDDKSGSVLSTGDINGDGYNELIIGAPDASPEDRTTAGSSYVIWSDNLIHERGVIDIDEDPEKVTKLFGDNQEDASGKALNAVDINGDGFDDLFIGSPLSDPEGRENAGKIHVIKGFGTTSAVSFSPADGQFVSKETDIEIVLNSDLDSYTINVVGALSGAVSGTEEWSVNAIHFSPSSSLVPGETYEVTVNGQNADNEAIQEKIWEFYVKTDEFPPEFISLSPQDGEINVASDQDIIVTFSHDIFPDSTFVTVIGDSIGIFTTTSSWQDSILTLAHVTSFTLDEIITVSISAADEYGDRADSTWSFSVRPEANPVEFTIAEPGNPENVSKDAFFRILFPADIDTSSIDFQLEGSLSNNITGNYSWSDTTYTFTPSDSFEPGETLLLTLSASDIYKNSFSDSLMTFTVKNDEIPPSIVNRSPAIDEKNVEPDIQIVFEFTDDVERDSTTVDVISALNNTLSMNESWTDYTLTLTKATSSFAYEDTITVTVNVGDRYANRHEYSWQFYITGDDEPPYFDVIVPGQPDLMRIQDQISLVFPDDIDTTSVTTLLTGSISGNVTGDWNWLDTTYVFTPEGYNPGETLSLTVNASDIYNNAIPDTTCVFNVKPDETPPSIIDRSPLANETNIPTTENIVIEFTDDVYPDSTTVSVRGAYQRTITMTKSWTEDTLTLINSNSFLEDETITVTVNTGDEYSNHLYYEWSFSTGPELDITYYTVTTSGNSDLMGKFDTITLSFSTAVDTTTIVISLTGSEGGAVNGTWLWSNYDYTFTPSEGYIYGETLSLTLNADDIHDNPIPESNFSFTVKGDESPPSVISHSPLEDEENVDPETDITIEFSSDVIPDSTVVSVQGSVQGDIVMLSTWQDSIVTLVNENSFLTEETITVSIDAGDLYANRMEISWSFTTKTETEPPYFEIVTPGDPEQFSENAPISVIFPSDIDFDSVDISIEGNISGLLSGGWSWSDTCYTFTPSEFYHLGEIITLTINAADTYGNILPETKHTVTVGEHTPWLTITSVEPADSTNQTYKINYSFGDPDNSYTKTCDWKYSVDGDSWHDITEDMITDNKTRPPGDYSVYWKLPDDFEGVYSENVCLRMCVYDGRFSSGFRISPPFTVDINQSPSVSIQSILNDSTASKLTVNYTISDTENNPVSLLFEYSYDFGATWLTGVPSDTITNISSSEYNGSFGWNYLEELEYGIDYFGVRIRLTPSDFKAGISDTSDFLNIDLNDPPSVELDDIYTTQSGDVAIQYHISDAENDTIRFVCFYSIDSGDTWAETQHISGADSILTYDGSMIWHSKEDVSSIESLTVRFRTVPWDHDQGTSGSTEVFQLFNNDSPDVTISLPDTVGNVVSIPFMITDIENDPANLSVMWSQNGETWNPATILGDTLNIGIDAYNDTLSWNSKDDVGEGFFEEMLLRILAGDESNPLGSSYVNSHDISFALDNEPPDFLSAWGYTGSDTVYFNFNESVTDTSVLDSDKFSLLPEMSIKSIHKGFDDFQFYALLDGNESLPLGTITISARYIKDSFLNNAEECVITFSPEDDNINPEISIENLTDEVSGDVSVYYQISDPEGDLISLLIYYTIDNGTTWNDATVTGATTDIGPTAYNGTFIWESSSDIPGVDIQNVQLKISAFDTQEGTPVLTNSFNVDNNIPPSIEISVAEPDSFYSNTIDISYSLDDEENDILAISAFYSTDNGLNYKSATVNGTLTDITTGQYSGTLEWETEIDFPDTIGTILFKLVPSDADPGTADSLSVHIDNFGVCEVAVSLPDGEQFDNITVTYHLTDPNDREIDLRVLYSVDQAITWESALVEGDLSQIGPAEYDGSFIWRSSEQLDGYEGTVQLKVIPNNNMDGVSDIDEVTVDYNKPPSIASLLIDSEKTHSGTMVITLKATDSENDVIDVQLEYSLDDGATYNPATLSNDTEIIPNITINLLWPLFDDIGYIYYQNVYLRVTVTDEDPGTPYETGPFTVTNLVGDYTHDLKIDGSDLPGFVDAWNNQITSMETGPVSGSPPELTVEPDGKVDFEDLAAFIWMWNWYTEQVNTQELTASKPAILNAGPVSDPYISITPCGNGIFSVNCADALDYINIFIESDTEKDLEVSVNESNSWLYDDQRVLLTRSYNNRLFEIAAVSLYNENNNTSESNLFATLQINNIDDDIHITYSYRMTGESDIITGKTILSKDNLFQESTEFTLYQNVPNPFNPSTTIEFSLPESGYAELSIFNIEGQMVRRLVSGYIHQGMHSVLWDGKDNNGNAVSSGVFISRLRMGNIIESRKMMMVK